MSAKFVEYKGVMVQRGSQLYSALVDEKNPGKAAQIFAETERQAKARGEVLPAHLNNYKVGNEPPETWSMTYEERKAFFAAQRATA